MTAETEPRDEAVRLSYAFIEDAKLRAQVSAIAAFIEVLRDVPKKVSEPLLGDIRYTWWLEAIGEISEGRKVRYHPLSAALTPLIRERGLDPEVFVAAIDAHRVLLEERLSLKAALELVDAADVALMGQAAKLLAPGADATHLTGPVRFYALAKLKPDEIGETEYRHLYREAREGFSQLPAKLQPLALPAALAWKEQGPLQKRLRLLWAFVRGKI